MNPTPRSIYQARRRLHGVARRTPLERSDWLSRLAGCDVHLKLECWQRTRSFKIRGAYNAVAALDADTRARGLVAASAGNHGQGVALAAKLVGTRATIFVPTSAPETKKAHIQALGAELRTVEGIYDDAQREAQDFAASAGAAFVHPFSDADVMAGQGTIGLEILETLPSVRELIVPVGGGGLIAGIGTIVHAIAGDTVRVIGVQTEETSSMYESFRAGRPVSVHPGETLADGLAGGVEPGSYERARAVTDEIVVSTEAALRDAIRGHYREDGIVAEGGGAAAAAAVLEGRIELRGPAVMIVSGGNIDANRLASILVDEHD